MSLSANSHLLLSQKGTFPCNTVPSYVISDGFIFLRCSVDSLYLSFKGDLYPEIQERLVKLKQYAQDSDVSMQALAQYSVEGHIFEVKSRGSGVYPFILDDGAFQIQFARSGKKLPMAYVQIRSKYLCSASPKDCVSHLFSVLNHFGKIIDLTRVSRADLCVDFCSDVDMDSWSRESWVTKARRKNNWSNYDDLSGWTIGQGGSVSFRFYNKLLEIYQKSKRFDLFDLWKVAGWQQGQVVWRGEFQFERDFLTSLGIISFDDLQNNLNSLWQYATSIWLRLTLPNLNDSRRDRWPTHPLWQDISSIDWKTHGSPLSRKFKPDRVPDDKRIFSIATGSIVSYMAKYGINDYHEAMKRFVVDHYEYLCASGELECISGDTYLSEKVCSRARKFNTILNPPPPEDKSASAYLAASDGY